jgi:hypothetical protein
LVLLLVGCGGGGSGAQAQPVTVTDPVSTRALTIDKDMLVSLADATLFYLAAELCEQGTRVSVSCDALQVSSLVAFFKK